MTVDDPIIEELTNGEKKQIGVRYGIVEYNDLLRDMSLWETLLCSSFLQRPHHILTEPLSDEWLEAQDKNLTSALAFGALTCGQNEVNEADLYETIVGIPHY